MRIFIWGSLSKCIIEVIGDDHFGWGKSHILSSLRLLLLGWNTPELKLLEKVDLIIWIYEFWEHLSIISEIIY